MKIFGPFLRIIVGGWLGFSTLSATAADRGYTATSGNWAIDANWSGGLRPQTGERSFIGSGYPGDGSLSAEVTLNTDETAQTVGEVWVGGYLGGGANAGTLNVQSSGNLLTGARMKIGGGVTGVVNQTGGTITWSAGDIVIGANDGGSNPGFYNLSGGLMTGMAGMLVGAGGTAGTLTMSGGRIQNSGDLYVGYSGAGVFAQSGGTNTVTGALRIGEGAGSSRYDLSGGRLVVNGGTSYVAPYYDATFNHSGGVAVFQTLELGYAANGAYNLSGGEMNATALNKTAGSTFSFTGGRLSVNTIGFSVVNNGGTLAPGLNHTVGATTINGDYTVGSASATLEVQLAGALSGEYDFLDVNGTLTLGGQLAVELSFTPAASDTFTVVEFNSLSGVFANAPISGNRYDLGAGNSFIVTYTANNVVLSDFAVIPEPSTFVLCGLALGLAGWRLRRNSMA
jgi:hypothetical protein